MATGQKIIYNVTVKVDKAISDEWQTWMKNTHIPEVLATGKFIEHRFCKLLNLEDNDGDTFAIQYLAANMAQYTDYAENHAALLQAAHQSRYQDRFAAFRTLMEVL